MTFIQPVALTCIQDGKPRLTGIAMVHVNESHATLSPQLIEILGAAMLGSPGFAPPVQRA